MYSGAHTAERHGIRRAAELLGLRRQRRENMQLRVVAALMGNEQLKIPKAKTIKAFCVSRDGVILLDRIEPWTDEGRADCLKTINRPAGERVITIRITQIDQ